MQLLLKLEATVVLIIGYYLNSDSFNVKSVRCYLNSNSQHVYNC